MTAALRVVLLVAAIAVVVFTGVLAWLGIPAMSTRQSVRRGGCACWHGTGCRCWQTGTTP